MFDSFFNNVSKNQNDNIIIKEISLYNFDEKNQNGLINYNFVKRLSNTIYINDLTKIKNYGSYILIINSSDPKGPSGIYCISRSDTLLPGNINKLIESKGVNGDFFELNWHPLEFPSIKYNYFYNSKETKKSYKLNLLIKIISSIP